ncbi:MAG: hypothetical protein IPM84_10305 [Anaerolineae bacterium]|nr:hypothetical protein [Anaerolineae bacterium]
MDRKHIHFDLAIPWPRLQWNRDAMRRFLPTPGNVLFTLLMIGLLLWASSAGALPLRLLGPNVPSTTTIAYQGRLADAGGSPLTGAYSIIFRLYNAASGGAPLWEEQWTGQNGVQVSDGLFNVMLGSLTPIPQAVVTGNNTLWLGITVGTDDEMAPRVQLGSVPFAVQALTVPDGSVTTGKIADQAVTSQKQSAVTYYLNDNGYVQTLSSETRILSEFNLQQVPAGDIAFYCSFIASTDATNGIAGSVVLQVTPGGDLNLTPTHIFSNHWDNYILHGRLQDFGGGSLTIRIIYRGEGQSINVYFGVLGDSGRFGRKCTVTAGI